VENTAYRGPVYIPLPLIDHLIAAGLTAAERMVALVALTSARLERDTGRWLVRWSGEVSARLAGVSRAASSGAKGKLDSAGAIVLVEAADRDAHRAELYDVSALIEAAE
jgi:hypothetical protein